MNDELFSPTIRDQAPPGRSPWRPESIVYPAFFGGPLAAATLGLLNGRRLGLPAGQMLIIAAAGVAGFAIRIGVVAAFDSTSNLRLVGIVTGILVWLVVLLFQRGRFRVAMLRGGKPARLILPGLLAAVGFAVIEAMVLVTVSNGSLAG
ncbi:hypothetical protein KOI35_15930 [Actinoplanes bogorensis]|uniref:Uncharacterized protein n=1 Tax=Paractinoplanes bogorensis TaxID=1610840 RepID=A0ABS5YNF2_9ACTN|nr:hypothetical protein [Actinoplanes bogorensis]MBU2664993.1 hypothetical protein [Actinoplanes bogorensis]